jgi:hypothetical protein
MADPSLVGEVNKDAHIVAIFIKDYWPLLLGLIGFIVSIFVVLKGKIPLLENRMVDAFNKLKKIEDGNYISKGTLFDANNEFKFQSVTLCTDMREGCFVQQKLFQDNFCKKLDTITFELKEIVHDADRKREGTRHEITAMNKQLIELMTQMKTILARDRREETAEMVQLVVRQVLTQMKNN